MAKTTAQPDPNKLIPFGVALPANLLMRLDELAGQERRSRNNMLAEIVERYLAAYETRGDEPA